MAGVSLRLLVLKTPQADKLRAFYQALGVELAEEKHGDGPIIPSPPSLCPAERNRTPASRGTGRAGH